MTDRETASHTSDTSGDASATGATGAAGAPDDGHEAGGPPLSNDAEAMAAGGGPHEPAAGVGGGVRRLGDRIFLGLTAGSGGFVVVLVGLIAFFLFDRAIPVIAQDHANFLFSRGFQVRTNPIEFGVLDLLWVTFISSAVALVLALPVSIGIALFITQYAPQALRKPVGYTIDLLAAIPSIIYGIWGIYILAPKLTPVQHVLYHLGFIPLFADKGKATGSIFDASRRAGDHDPADRHRDRPRRVRTDAARRTSRRPSRWAPRGGR